MVGLIVLGMTVVGALALPAPGHGATSDDYVGADSGNDPQAIYGGYIVGRV